MTYLGFHCVFTLPLLAFMLYLSRGIRLERKSWIVTVALIGVALTYTAPWDSYLIRSGVWTYPPDAVLATFLAVPLEEYFFIFIQSLIACLWAMHCLKGTEGHTGPVSKWGLLPLSALPICLYFVHEPSTYRYLYLIIAWAFPVLLFQAAVGGSVLWKFRRSYAMIALPVTLYFWFADSVAVYIGIWGFPSDKISGWALPWGLPVEEALFFLVTNCMLAQGFILYQKLPLPRMVYLDSR